MSNDIAVTIQNYLDESVNKEERLNKILDLIHILNFEKRLAELTDAETDAMMAAGSLNEKQIQQIKLCDNEESRERLIADFSRQQYFLQCAWTAYLNGTDDFKPFCSKREAERIVDILKTE
ncbi:MAG TPA: hypothetical protein VFM18_17050 [Methanosarcina sp.]|nr:hypothetical protein [Methanosarcina sp.]